MARPGSMSAECVFRITSNLEASSPKITPVQYGRTRLVFCRACLEPHRVVSYIGEGGMLRMGRRCRTASGSCSCLSPGCSRCAARFAACRSTDTTTCGQRWTGRRRTLWMCPGELQAFPTGCQTRAALGETDPCHQTGFVGNDGIASSTHAHRCYPDSGRSLSKSPKFCRAWSKTGRTHADFG